MLYHVLQAVSPQGLYWRIPTQDRVVYLTFDDGPTPGVTEPLLDTLAAHHATATMFLVGRNAEDYPRLTAQIVAAGHGLGNHTWTHRDAWRTPSPAYLAEVERTQACLSQYGSCHWFRPPYGKLNLRHLPWLRQHQLQTALWSGLGWDWDAARSPTAVLQRLRNATAPGAVLVLHDSRKAAPRMLPMLDPLLRWLTSQGYRVQRLPDDPFTA